MALIYKYLFNILKLESELNGEDKWGKAGFQELHPHFVDFQKAIHDSETSSDDKLTLYPKYLKCASRLMSKLVSVVSSEVFDEKLLLVVITSLSSLHKTLKEQGEKSIQSLQVALYDDEASVVMIVLHLLSLFESFASSLNGKTTVTRSDMEPLTAASLDLYILLLSAICLPDKHGKISENNAFRFSSHRLSLSFEGSLGSQVVLSLLTVCKHKAKHIATTAADALLLTMRGFTQHRGTWRACFPGTFSGLFVITQSGFKSGSNLLSKTLLALIELVYIVCQDSLPENVQLLSHLALKTKRRVTSNNSKAIETNDPFTLWKSKLNSVKAGKHANTDHKDENSADGNVQSVGQGIGTLEDYVHWRVQLLQRIQSPLGSAYRVVNNTCTPLQRAEHARQFSNVLGKCAAFLGTKCLSESALELLGGMVDDTTLVRDTVGKAWQEFQLMLMQNKHAPQDAYLNMVNSLGDSFMSTSRSAMAAAAIGNETKLKDHLRVLIGMGFALRDRIPGVVRISDNSRIIVRMLRELVKPDSSACGLRVTTSVLETRKFCYATAPPGVDSSKISVENVKVLTVEASYHRVVWKSAQEGATKDLALRLVLTLGRSGIIGDILKFSEKSFGTLQQQLSSLRSITAYSSDNNGENKQSKVSSKNSMESLPEIICRAAGALMVLNTAILGMANVRIVNTVKATAKPVSCGSCGKTGTVKEMLRCGRCKVMHYCNRAHQTLHWATHKASCTSTDEVPSARTTVANGSSSSSESIAVNLDSPISLLTSPRVLITPLGGKAEIPFTNTYSVARLIYVSTAVVQHYLCVIDHYLALRSSDSSKSNSPSSQQSSLSALFILTAGATEGLANMAFTIGADAFEPHIKQCLYPLLELLVDSEPIIKQAARSSLERLAIYTNHNDLRGIIRTNLDYIVDAVCRELRSPSTFRTMHLQSSVLSTVSMGCASAHLIVDAVFSALGATVTSSSSTVASEGILDEASGTGRGSAYASEEFDKSEGIDRADLNSAESVGVEVSSAVTALEATTAPMYLLRDVICDTLSNIDAFSVESRFGVLQLQALLRVLHVLACRAAPIPAVPAALVYSDRSKMSQSTELKGGKDNDNSTNSTVLSFANKAGKSLLDFTYNLLLLQRSEDPGFNQTGISSSQSSAKGNTTSKTSPADDPDEIENENPSTATPTPAVQLLLDVIERCCLYVTLPHTASQVTVVETLSAAFIRLSAPQDSVHLLPCIHKTWPVIMNRIKDLSVILRKGATYRIPAAKSASTHISSKEKSPEPAVHLMSGVSSSKVLLSLGDALEKGSSSPSFLTAVSTTRKSNHGGKSTFSSSISSSNEPVDVSRALVLPALYQLVGVISAAASEFMTIRLKQEFLPETFQLLSFCLIEYVNDTRTTQSSGQLQRAQLLISSDSNSDANLVPSTKASTAVSEQASSKFSLWSKVKYAMVEVLTQCSKGEGGIQRTMQSHAMAISYLCLPLLATHESETVRKGTESLLLAALALDAPAVFSVLSCVSEQQSNADQWKIVTYSPSITALFGNSSGCSPLPLPRADNLLKKYREDVNIVASICALLKNHSSASAAENKNEIMLTSSQVSRTDALDSLWRKKLELWSAV